MKLWNYEILKSAKPYCKAKIFRTFVKKKVVMTHAEKYIIESYSGLFDSLSSIGKIELLEKLAKSLKKDNRTRERDFYKSFGAFGSDKPAEEIVTEIKESRKFRKKDLEF